MNNNEGKISSVQDIQDVQDINSSRNKIKKAFTINISKKEKKKSKIKGIKEEEIHIEIEESSLNRRSEP